MSASVKIMLSYDYNHFEVCIGNDNDLSITEINEMRKNAQRLADEAVRQYKIAKEKSMKRLNLEYEKNQLLNEIKRIKDKPEPEWTASEKAQIKALEDKEYWGRYDYDYENGCF